MNQQVPKMYVWITDTEASNHSQSRICYLYSLRISVGIESIKSATLIYCYMFSSFYIQALQCINFFSINTEWFQWNAFFFYFKNCLVEVNCIHQYRIKKPLCYIRIVMLSKAHGTFSSYHYLVNWMSCGQYYFIQCKWFITNIYW